MAGKVAPAGVELPEALLLEEFEVTLGSSLGVLGSVLGYNMEALGSFVPVLEP